MGKKMTKAGMVLRRAIRADIEVNPSIDHKILRSKYTTGEGIIESALAKSVNEWDALIAATPDEAASEPKDAPSSITETQSPHPIAISPIMPGLEQGVIKFTRKPAKMGEDYIFWVPRVYIKNGLVDPHAEYEVYLKKRT